MLAAGPLGRVGSRALAKAADDGTAIVQHYATFPDDPWAVAHGRSEERRVGKECRL